jgi:hypothetical protein
MPPAVAASDSRDPSAFFPHGFERRKIAGIEEATGGGEELSAPKIVAGVAGIDGDELEDAGVAVTVDHAAGAAVADEP